MKRNKANAPEVSSLRNKAEEQLKAKQSLNASHLRVSNEQPISDDDFFKLHYELEVQQIELELQNEELRQALNKAETAIALYDFSPVGYFTLERDGTISQLNLSGAKMLGLNRSGLVNINIKPFVSHDTLPLFNNFLLKAFETNSKQSCEVVLVSQENSSIVHVEGIVSINEQKCHLTALDITELTLSERSLKENEEKYRLMVDLSPDGVIIHSNGKIMFANATALSFIGASSLDQVLNKSVIDFVHPDYRNLAIERIKNIYISKEPSRYTEEKFINLNKDIIDVEVIGIPIRYMGKPAIQTIVRNITDRKRSEEALLRSEARHKTMVANMSDDITSRKRDEEMLGDSETRYRRLFESAKDGILIIDAGSGKIVDVNPFLTQMLGYSHDELLGKELWKIGVFKNIAHSKEAFIELQDKEYIRVDDMTLETKTGKSVNVEFVSNVYLVNQKKVIQCNVRDITERLKAEKEINTLGKAIEQGPSSIVITDADGKIEFVNQKFTAMTLYHLQEVKGKSPRIFNPGRLPENEFVELWETLKDGKTWEGEVFNRRKDHTYYWEEVSISAVKNVNGTIGNYILIQNDISEKKRIMTDLVEAKEKAVESDRLKSAFLANMSHEIRTPLNSIIGFSELMSEPDFDISEQFHFTQIIHNSGTKLLSIISDIMDLSKIEAGEVQVNSRPLSVHELVMDIQKEYLFKSIEKGIEFRIDLPDLKDVVIESDENKLKQILINFVGNAIKFTDNGFVEIGVKADGEFILFHIKDSGIGIPYEFQAHIFERFRQVESAFTRKHGGNGLGLAISKALVELLGGRVWMETQPGKGSTFYFTIPLSN